VSGGQGGGTNLARRAYCASLGLRAVPSVGPGGRRKFGH
jgi:hypothetical protein